MANIFGIIFLVFIIINKCYSQTFLYDNFFETENEDFQKYYWQTIKANITEIIGLNGFDIEEYVVQTPDGYLLSVYRIVNPIRRTNRNGYPIILFNGFMEDAHGFIINTDGWFDKESGNYYEYENSFKNRLQVDCQPKKVPEKAGRSIAFTLAACGFDVWLANRRDSDLYSSNIFYDTTGKLND